MKTNESKLTSDIRNYRHLTSKIVVSEFMLIYNNYKPIDKLDGKILKNKLHINADDHRFVNLNIQNFSVVCQGNGLIKSQQRTQNFTIPVNKYEKVTVSRFRTQMTRIAQIFTDPCASVSSAQSAFYRDPSALICVHLRLNKSQIMASPCFSMTSTASAKVT